MTKKEPNFKSKSTTKRAPWITTSESGFQFAARRQEPFTSTVSPC